MSSSKETLMPKAPYSVLCASKYAIVSIEAMVVHGHELHVLAPYKRAHDQTPYATHPVHGNAFHELSPFPSFRR